MRGILFDKDGTLFDFEATWLPALKRLALDAANGDEALAAALLVEGGFNPATGKIRSGSVIGAGTTALIVDLWHPGISGDARHAAMARMDATFLDHGSKASVPIDGADVVLDVLAARGFVMGVATNDVTDAAVASVEATGLGRHLRLVYGYDSVPNPKPAPDMLLAFAAAARLEPKEIIVVGDNAHDLVMAKTGGAGLAVGVTSGNSAKADLEALADVVLPSIRELPGWLAERTAR